MLALFAGLVLCMGVHAGDGLPPVKDVQVRADDYRDTEGYTVEMAIPRAAVREAIGDKPIEGQTRKMPAVRVELSRTLETAQKSSTSNSPRGDMHGDINHDNGYFTLTFK